MYCYKCGCELNRSNRCPNCGADVTKYKKIIYTSNYLYNTGLEKAQVRDLSGAIVALKESLWYDKNNLDARNLLGLVYYEIGEVVAALSEWVISKNINDTVLHRKDNPGEKYLNDVQSSQQTTSNLSASIRRYNHALECCYADNLDVAILQLKKVLQQNPHYLRARQLLALIYIRQNAWGKAERELRKCQRLDINNTTTLRYLKEVGEKLSPQNAQDDKARLQNSRTRERNSRERGDVIKYTADNETIIQPVGTRTPGLDGFGFPPALMGGLIGLVIGAAILGFLVLPARVQIVRQEAAQQVREISSEADSKDSQITQLKSQVETLTQQNEALSSTDAVGGDSDTIAANTNALLSAASAYFTDSVDLDAAVAAFEVIQPDTAMVGTSDQYNTLYRQLYSLLGPQILQQLADSGMAAYEQDEPDYAAAVSDLEKANYYENPDKLGQTFSTRLFYIGNSYYQLYTALEDKEGDEAAGDLSRAKGYLSKAVRDYPNADFVSKANEVLASIPEGTESYTVRVGIDQVTGDETDGTVTDEAAAAAGAPEDAAAAWPDAAGAVTAQDNTGAQDNTDTAQQDAAAAGGQPAEEETPQTENADVQPAADDAPAAQ